MIHSEKRLSHLMRLLVLEIRSTRVAYVVLEGPTSLLDWGILHKTHVQSILERRLARLFLMSRPLTILISHNAKSKSGYRLIIRAVHKNAKEIGVPVLFMPRRAVLRYFVPGMRLNKYARAKMVAERFPTLSWRLPRERKSWQSEPVKIAIFDAAAAGVAYFLQVRDRE